MENIKIEITYQKIQQAFVSAADEVFKSSYSNPVKDLLTEAIKGQDAPTVVTGVKWADALSAFSSAFSKMMRPLITFQWLIVLYPAVIVAGFVIAVANGGNALAAMGAASLEALLAAHALPRTTALLGVYDFAGDTQRYARLLQHWLAQAPAHSIIMCHPGQATVPGDAIGAARVREFAYLGSAAFADALAQARVHLVRGAALAAH